MDEEQTVTHPALSGNNIHFSEKYFLRSDKEIPPLLKYVVGGGGNTVTYFLPFVFEGNEMEAAPVRKTPKKDKNTGTLCTKSQLKTACFYLQHYYSSINKHCEDLLTKLCYKNENGTHTVTKVTLQK